jgi:hypothetical protein
MPSKTSEYLPRPVARAWIVSFCSFARARGERVPTDLAYYLIVLQHPPCNVYAIIVPVRPWHLLVDISIDAGHLAAGLLAKAEHSANGKRLKRVMGLRDSARGLSRKDMARA